MSVRSKASGPRTEVTITGTLSRVDADGVRPLTYDEFVDFVSSAADHLHDDGRLVDPMVSGQAGTGELSISFRVPVSIGAPELTVRLSEIIDSLNDALGLVWPHDPVPPARGHGTTMLNPTSQHLDGIGQPAFA
ncbi:hypothetical protein [Candidatus Poriferisodalis sp.]|uniref:hypothetical protein n=1 Tax=Candidatus Poriferisodalis sp. TaxID=3101277 RepID=UPI003B02372C